MTKKIKPRGRGPDKGAPKQVRRGGLVRANRSIFGPGRREGSPKTVSDTIYK